MFRCGDSTHLYLKGSAKEPHKAIAIDDIASLVSQWSVNKILKESATKGNTFVVHDAIEKGATDWNWGLWGACGGGHLELVNLMIEKGATITQLFEKTWHSRV